MKMKLTDENGKEWEFNCGFHAGYENKMYTGYLSEVRPKPKVIDWSKVSDCVPVNAGVLLTNPVRFCSRTQLDVGSETGLSLETGKWVPWFGGDEPPVPEGVMVECVSRNGKKEVGLGGEFCWHHSRHYRFETDIIAFRVAGLEDGYCYSGE